MHDYKHAPNCAEDCAYASRQARRAQILAEIEKLKPGAGRMGIGARISSAVLLLWTAGNATVYYLFR